MIDVLFVVIVVFCLCFGFLSGYIICALLIKKTKPNNKVHLSESEKSIMYELNNN